MNMKSEKKELVFIPHYLGSLLYFEKLRPFLEREYTVVFFLLPLNDGKYVKEMDNFCKERGLNTCFITQAKTPWFLKRMPFYHQLKQVYLYKKEIADLLGAGNIQKIIAVNDCGFPLDYFFVQARRRGVDTMVLQWALFSSGQREVPIKISRNFFRIFLFRYGKPLYEWIRKMLFQLVLGEKVRVLKDVLGNGSAERFGVINKDNFDRLVSLGVPAKKMSVVGYMDFYLAEAAKGSFDRDLNKKADAAKRLGIDASRRNIIIFSSSYNSDVVRTMDDRGQLDFYRHMIDLVRQACPASHFHISLKIHPREDIALYEPLRALGVSLYDKHADNFMLVYFSDLYIADSTTTNFIPMVMDKEAIFVNFLKMELIEKTKNDFSIKQYVSDEWEFKKLLADFREGKLERQYNRSNDIITEDSLRKIVSWID